MDTLGFQDHAQEPSVSLLRFLGLVRSPEPTSLSQTESARRLVAELENLSPDQARYVAAFAYLLGRLARADLQISDEETSKMESIVASLAGLPSHQAALVVEIACHQNELFGGTENFLVAREFNQIATREQKLRLLECLFAVAAADGTVSAVEDDEIRRIANELCLTHAEFIRARSAYREHLAVLKG
jgi:uncharacterized tellurite resistance protein B-like protein